MRASILLVPVVAWALFLGAAAQEPVGNAIYCDREAAKTFVMRSGSKLASEVVGALGCESEVAADFVPLASSSDLTLEVYGGAFGTGNLPAYYSVRFYDDGGCTPSNLLAEFCVPAGVPVYCRTDSDGLPIYKYTFRQMSVLFIPGNLYWCSVRAADPHYPPQWGVEMDDVPVTCEAWFKASCFPGYSEWTPMAQYAHMTVSVGDSAGEVVAIGLNQYGQCDIPAPNDEFIAVSGGFQHSLGLKSDGTIVAWGWNAYGQCSVPSPNTDFVAVDGGSYHSLGLKSDGTIVLWGRNDYGQCNPPSPNGGFIAIAAGCVHSLGLKSDGTIVAWGHNGDGECNVPAPNAGFVAVAAGSYHSLGLKSDGTIVCWGRNDYGQCDVPATRCGYTATAGGDYHSLGLKSDGTIVAWGRNDDGQCNVPAPNAGFQTVSGGHQHSLGLKSDGTIVAWGLNADGQCNFPPPNSGFMGAAAGGFHSLGLKGEGTAAIDDPGPYAASGADPLRILFVTPNPIASSADILFETRASGPVSMTVLDVGGRQVTTAALGSFGPGRHQTHWDGGELPSGSYFLRLQGAAGRRSAVRVLLIR
jgi:hypothetical protein